MFLRQLCLLVGGMLCLSQFLLTSSRAFAEEGSTDSTQIPADAVKIGFSNLVIKANRNASVAIADEGSRAFILEELRKLGVAAVGAESLVFGTDRSSEADLLLGGTVAELECRSVPAHSNALNCRVRVDWEVLDPQRQEVIYRHSSWAAAYNASSKGPERTAERLLSGAVKELAKRTLFQRLFDKEARGKSAVATVFPAGTLAACPDSKREMPKQAESLLNAVVIVEFKNGHGSGFFVGNGPFIATAAHVADAGAITVKTRTGGSSRATVVRLDADNDVALLRLEDPIVVPGCLPLESALPPIGSPIYAMGAPLSTELGFSLSQGIVSGIRVFKDVSYIQTDTSVNPGNSGGPLVNQDGKVVGIVSFKAVKRGVEGIAFAVPMNTFSGSLGVSLGSATSDNLMTERFAPRVQKTVAVVDPANAVPPFDREAVALLAKEKERESRSEALSEITPWYVPTLRWGGVGLASAGLTVAVYSFLSASSVQTASSYYSAQTFNDVGWIGVGVGAAAFALSFPLAPSLPENFDAAEWRKKKGNQTAGALHFSVSPSHVAVQGVFQ